MTDPDADAPQRARASTRPDPTPRPIAAPPHRSAPGRRRGLGRRRAGSPSSLVAVLAGSRCSCPASRSARARRRRRARRPTRQAAFQPFWDTYRSITEDYAGGPVDRKTLDRRRDPGHDRRARRPVLRLPQPRRVPPVAAGPVGPVRGHRRRGRDASDQRPATARRSAPAAAWSSSQPIAGAPAEKAGLLAGDRDHGDRRHDRRRADRRRGAGQGPRTEGHDGHPHDRARRGARRSTSPIVRDVIVQPRSSAQLARRRRRRLHQARRLQRPAPRPTSDDGRGATSPPAQKLIIVDLRGNPGGFVTDAQQVDQPVRRRPGPRSSRQEDAAGNAHADAGPGRWRRHRSGRSRSSS